MTKKSEEYLPKEKFDEFIEGLKNKTTFLHWCEKFHNKEGRDLIYVFSKYFLEKAPTKKLYRLAAIEIILMIWNMAWYQRLKKEKKEQLETNINTLLEEYKDDILPIKDKIIFAVDDNDKEKMIYLFKKFKNKLGTPVGAAKVLHILNSELFPIWDRKVSLNYHKHYHRGKHEGGALTGNCYFQFCLDCKEILRNFNGTELWDEHKNLVKIQSVLTEFPDFRESLLKMFDECNYEAITEELRG